MYDKILTLKRTSKDTFGLFAPKGHMVVELTANTEQEAKDKANAWVSSFSSVTVRAESTNNDNDRSL